MNTVTSIIKFFTDADYTETTNFLDDDISPLVAINNLFPMLRHNMRMTQYNRRTGELYSHWNMQKSGYMLDALLRYVFSNWSPGHYSSLCIHGKSLGDYTGNDWDKARHIYASYLGGDVSSNRELIELLDVVYADQPHDVSYADWKKGGFYPLSRYLRSEGLSMDAEDFIEELIECGEIQPAHKPFDNQSTVEP